MDLIRGQLAFEARDLSKAALSVADKIDVTANGSLLDGILARHSALGRLRKEASLASSAELRSYGGGAISKREIIARASDDAAAETATLKEVLKNDPDNALLEGYLHFTAESNGSAQTFKDFNEFFKRKLRGYKQGDVYQRNAILNEMATMGVNSMLSGPKTPVRALVGTGLGTVMRPVATMLGAVGKSDDTVMRGAFQNIGGMVEARNEAWKKAVADFQSYNMNAEGFRGYIKNKKDQELQSNDMSKLCDAIQSFPLPTVCALNGSAYGGGVEIACACDFRISVSNIEIMVQCRPMDACIQCPLFGRIIAKYIYSDKASVIGFELEAKVVDVAGSF